MKGIQEDERFESVEDHQEVSKAKESKMCEVQVGIRDQEEWCISTKTSSLWIQPDTRS